MAVTKFYDRRETRLAKDAEWNDMNTGNEGYNCIKTNDETVNYLLSRHMQRTIKFPARTAKA